MQRRDLSCPGTLSVKTIKGSSLKQLPPLQQYKLSNTYCAHAEIAIAGLSLE